MRLGLRAPFTCAFIACSAPTAPTSTIDDGASPPAHAGASTTPSGASGGAPMPTGGAGGGASTTHTAGAAGNATTPTVMLTLKQPIAREGKLVLEFGSTYFAVDPEHGGRIISLRAHGQELLKLTGAPNFADAFGSTFWPSPQSWPWPPPAQLDTEAYASRVDAPHTLVLSSEPHDATNLQVTKRFAPDLAREAVQLEYAMTNTGEAPISWAPWEITRMPADGLAFWPTGGAPFGESPLAHQAALGHTWCRPGETEGEAKLFADGAGGYLAYAVGQSILIKEFADIPASAAAPSEAEVELYVSPDHSYVEVENQGAYASIAPGQTVSWQVTWYARRLPPGVTLTAGNADLIAFVRETLQ